MLLLVVLLAAALYPVAAQEIRLDGATTTIDRVITPYKAAVEKATGFKLVVVGNNTGRGLVDLVEKKCDASLASEPIEIAVAAAKAAGTVVDPAKLKMSVVKYDEIVFIVHKSNPVKKLTWQQIKDIHTGKIANWKDVGGKNAPITVYSDAPTGGTRAMIKSIVLEGQEYGPAVQAQSAVKKVNEMVANDENGFGGLGLGFVDTDLVTIVETKKIERPLGFLTFGEPTGNVAKVIKAFQDAAKK